MQRSDFLGDTSNKILERIRQIINSPKRNTYIVIAGIVAVMLIVFSDCSNTGDDTLSASAGEVFDYNEYSQRLEDKVEKIVESIEGAGKCSVMITLEKTEEYVFFTEEKISTNTEEETAQDKTKQTIESDKETKAGVVENRNNGNDVLVTTTLMPQVGGVVVICEGGGSVLVQERVTNAVATALNISHNKVFVTKKQR